MVKVYPKGEVKAQITIIDKKTNKSKSLTVDGEDYMTTYNRIMLMYEALEKKQKLEMIE